LRLLQGEFTVMKWTFVLGVSNWMPSHLSTYEDAQQQRWGKPVQ